MSNGDGDVDPFAAFGSDSESDQSEAEAGRPRHLSSSASLSPSSDADNATLVAKEAAATAADTVALHVTKRFLSGCIGGSSARLSDRHFALPPVGGGTEEEGRLWRSVLSDRFVGRGVRTVEVVAEEGPGGGSSSSSDEEVLCDSAALFRSVDGTGGANGGGEVGPMTSVAVGAPLLRAESNIKKGLVAGGSVLLFFLRHLRQSDVADMTTAGRVLNVWDGTPFHEAVWDVEHAEIIHHRCSSVVCTGTGNGNDAAEDKKLEVTVLSIAKRPCTVNASSCPWKESGRRVVMPPDLVEVDGEHETWAQYERRILAEATVTRTASDMIAKRHRHSRRKQKEQPPGCGDGNDSNTKTTALPPLPDESVRRAVTALRTHGFVVIRDLFDPATQTIPWGEAVLSDFKAASAVLFERDKVDILNPGGSTTGGGMGGDPLNYREMAMREDLRVDIRDGPNMKSCRKEENETAYVTMLGVHTSDDGATVLTSAEEGLCDASIRFDPTVLRVVRSVFNPHADADDYNRIDHDNEEVKLYQGNFGRWNFGGAGPNGTPQPLRVGQVGSVVSLPGCADQAVHADTPHLFEHVDCLPCHYANLFTPGARVDGPRDADGNWTGDAEAGGTAFVHGSHKLGVTARLTAERGGASGREDGSSVFSAAGSVPEARDEMHIRTIRPSLQLGDALIFDCRILHFGLANRSIGDALSSTGRRPLLYVNMTHSFFHDPKNWDLRKKIF